MANLHLLQKGDLKKSDFTNDNSNNKEGIGIRLSSDNGNLLQQRKNGLYYGIEAPPNLANLYVDAVNGVDQHPEEVAGAGTRAKPLKTFAYANEVAFEGTTRKIYLMSDQDHIVPSSAPAQIKAGYLTVLPYGPILDAYKVVHVVSAAVYRAMRDDNKLPRLVLNGLGTSKWYGAADTDVVQLATIFNKANTLFEAVHVVLDNEGTITPTAPERTKLQAYYVARICNENTLTFSFCKVTSRGTTVTSPQYVRGIVTTYTKETGIIPKFNKNFIGLVAGTATGEVATIVRYIAYESYNMFTSMRGSGAHYLGSINLRDAELSDNHEITNYVYDKTFDEFAGGKVIINPTTDVPSNQWY